MVSDHHGVQVLHHAGGVMGGVCMCMTVEALGLDVIIIANRGDTPVQPLGFQVIDACVDGLAEVPTADAGAVAAAPVGAYFCAETAAPLEIKLDDGKPSVKLHGQQIPVRVDEVGALVCTLPVIDFAVTRQPGGALAVYARGVTDIFQPAAEADEDANAEAARLAGVYRCDEMESVAELRVVDGEPRLTMSGPYGRDRFALTRFAPLIWTSSLGETGFGGVLAFKAEAGRIVGFDLSTARTTKLPYVRSA
jgi:hypothetical protein